MKKQLKKKAKIQDIVFPTSLLRPGSSLFSLPEQPQPIALISRKPSLNSKHRTLSRSNDKSQKIHRSASLGKKAEKKIAEFKPQQSLLKGWTKQKFVKSRSGLKKRNNSNSAAEIASLFYKDMEQNLARECQSILRMQKQTRSQSSCQLQALNAHVFLVQKNNQEAAMRQPVKKEEVVKKPSEFEEQSEPTSMVRVETASDSSETDKKQVSQRQAELQEVQFSDGPLSSIKQIEDSFLKKKSDIMDKRPLVSSHKSIMNSQTRFQKMCNSLITTKAHMVSSKMLAKSVGLFSISKVEFHSKIHSELSLLFEIAGQTVFKKIKSMEKQPTQLKQRKHHMRMQHMRQRSRDKIFEHFSRKGVSTSLVSLYQDILAYIEQHTMIDRSYRGLILIDQDENNLFVSNPERILQILNINTCFYFILRLGSTFYLVKATNNQLRGIHFTFLCDFTTLSTGDQLVFPHFTPFPQTKPKKFKTAMSKAVYQFKEGAEDQWSRGQLNAQALSKIGKITIQTLQKQDSYSLGLWNVNKKYAMVGEATNFFQMHDHFDYGFFKKQLSFFKAGPLFYTLSKRKPILFYQYPFSYQLIEANQIQRQALVIAHLSALSRPNNFEGRAITSFYKRSLNRTLKQSNKQFVIRLTKQIVTVRLGPWLQLFVESSTTLRGNKIKVSNQKAIKRVDPSVVSSLNETVEKTLSQYRLQQSFLYRRYQLVKKPIILMYYKALHKFQGHFAFVSLYKLLRVNVIQFKIHTFHLGRSFAVHLEASQVTPENVKQTVSSLISIFKNTYFKKVLQLEVRKSQKRKKDALEDFFRNQVKFNPNNIRVKRKNEDQLRKKNLMRVGTLHPSPECNPIEQILISKICKTYDEKEVFISLKFLSEKEVKERKGDVNEKVVICLYFANRMTYFRYVCSLKELVSITIPQWSSNQQLDPRQLLCILQVISQNLMRVIEHTTSSFKFLLARLKHLLHPNRKQKNMSAHPYLFRLIGRNIFQTKEGAAKTATPLSTKLSIDLDLQKNFSPGSSYIIEDRQFSSVQLKLASPSLDVLQQNQDKAVEIIYMVNVAPQWLIEVVDVYDQGSKSTAGLIERDRRVRLVHRTTEECLQLGEWEADFVSNIRFASYNKRMLKRLLRGVRSLM